VIQRSIPLSTRPHSLHDLCRGLMLLNGLSVQETAFRSGVSPGSVAALCERTPQQIDTWMRLLGAVGATVAVQAQGQQWSVTLPRAAAPRVALEWDHWRHRRLVSALNHVNRADAKLKRAARDEKAQSYVTNEEGRLRARLTELRGALKALSGRHRADGLRAVIQLIAAKIGLKAEELALMSGVSLGAAQLALGDDQDGRLATLHRVLSALNARLHIQIADSTIDIALCPPGDWRPGEAASSTTRRTAGRSSPGQEDGPNRSRISSDDILALYDRGLSIGEIARKAGVSRQRVHKIAMDHGRTPRRVQAREQRESDGRATLDLAPA